jgi:PAS domain S-box-containing protein/putative nucleotidyltransferase with HDIG domain
MATDPAPTDLTTATGEAFESLFSRNPLPMWIYDLETLQFLDVNAAALAKYGYSRGEFLRMKITDIRPREDVDRLLANIRQQRPDLQVSGEWRHQLKGGQLIIVEITSYTLEYRGRKAALVVVHDVTARKEAQAHLEVTALENAELLTAARRRADEFNALLDITRDLGQHLDLSTVLRLVVERAVRLLGATGGFVYLYDPERRDLEVVEVRDVPSMQAGARLHLGEGLAGIVAQTREAQTVDNYATWTHRADQYAGIPASAVAGAPMLFGGDLIGVLGVADLGEGTRVFTPDDVRLLSLFAGQTASAVHNARLFEQTQRSLRRLTALRTIDVAITASVDLRVTLAIFLDQVTAQLQVDAADILLLRPHTNLLEYAAGRGFQTDAIIRSRLRLGEGLAGKTALERRTISAPNHADLTREFSRAGLLAGEGFNAYYATPLVAKGAVQGILEVFYRRPTQIDPEWVSFFESLAGQAAIAIDNASLFTSLQRSNVDLSLAYDTTLEGWSKALDLRDRETEGHSLRVTEMTMDLARAVGMSEADLVHVRRGALLHDIGKMGIPDAILLKPGPLTDDEWVIMRQHPVFAYELLSPIAFLKPALDIPYAHHEKWDGTGYPRGLKGDQIPLAARIFAVVDVWDALRSARPYREAWPKERVRAHIRDQAGTHFDPDIAETFLELDSGENMSDTNPASPVPKSS